MTHSFPAILIALAVTVTAAGGAAQQTNLTTPPTRAEAWQQIRDALEDQDWSIAWPLLEGLAEQGDGDAALRLANMLDQGLGMRRDSQKAFFWYHKAAERKIVPAMRHTAIRYLNGNGTDRNHKMAAFWYFAAAQTGDAEASWSLARLYESGIGVEQNLAISLGWYSLSAQKGWKPALDRLAEIVSRQQRLDKLPRAASRDALAAAAPTLPVLKPVALAPDDKTGQSVATPTPSASGRSASPAPAPQQATPSKPAPAPDLFTNTDTNNRPTAPKQVTPPKPPENSPGPAFSLILDTPPPGDTE